MTNYFDLFDNQWHLWKVEIIIFDDEFDDELAVNNGKRWHYRNINNDQVKWRKEEDGMGVETTKPRNL